MGLPWRRPSLVRRQDLRRWALLSVLFALELHLVLPQQQPPPSSNRASDRVVKCSEQKDATRARKLAVKQVERGQLEKAEGCARAVLRIRGDTASAADWEQLGMILNMRGKMQGAVNALRNAVSRDDRVKPPTHVRVERRMELASALLGLARPDDAMEQYRVCAQLAPHMPGPYINGGNVHLHRGNFAGAEHFYRTALQLDPANFDAIVNYGALLQATARGDLAVQEYRRALALDPVNVDALSNFGSLQMDIGDIKGGLAAFQEAFRLDDERAPLCYNMANAYLANGQVQDAIESYERAIALDPMLLSAKCSVASLFAMHGRYEEAKSLVQQAVNAVAPDAAAQPASSDGMWRLTAKCLLVSFQVETCEWGAETDAELQAMVSAFISDMLAASQARARGEQQDSEDEQRRMRLRAISSCLAPSRALFVHGMDPHQALLATIYLSQQALERAQALPRLMPPSTHLLWQSSAKLGIGYVFVGHESNRESLMTMVFLARHSTAHDGRRVSHCYSLRSDGDDAHYMEMKLLCGKRFHDLSHLSHAQAAKTINSHGVHILVDTVGHSYGARHEVLAMHPSALQVEVKALNSHGTDRVVISDRIVTPPEHLPPRRADPALLLSAPLGPNPPASATSDRQHMQIMERAHMTESVVMLPARVSATFSSRHHHPDLHDLPLRTDPLFKRRTLQASLGLAPNASVTSNASAQVILTYGGRLHAVTDRSLRAWVSVLNAVPAAILVLSDHPPGARAQLLRRAVAAGLTDGDLRVVSHRAMALNETARCEVFAVSDLVLDAPASSVGGAAAQALLSSAPLISLPQRSLVSRIATSQVLAAYPEPGGPPLLEDHAPHLIARNMHDFVELAVRSARLKMAASDGDDWLPFVPYHDIREQLLLHDGTWWQKYNRGMRMVWETHLFLFLATDSEASDTSPSHHLFPSSARRPHIVVA